MNSRGDVPEAAEKTAIAAPVSASSDPLREFSLHIGDRLRRLMLREGVSLERLSDFSGVCTNKLARITSGETVPTISLLWKIANAFGVPFGSLIATRERRGSFILREAQKTVLSSGDGKFTSRALFPYSNRRLVEFYEIKIGREHIEHSVAHVPGTIESLVVARGKIEITSGKETPQILGKGDAIVFEADVPHSYRNLGKTDALLYLVMSYDNVIATSPA